MSQVKTLVKCPKKNLSVYIIFPIIIDLLYNLMGDIFIYLFTFLWFKMKVFLVVTLLIFWKNLFSKNAYFPKTSHHIQFQSVNNELLLSVLLLMTWNWKYKDREASSEMMLMLNFTKTEHALSINID
jgi:hypothetical protein